MMPRLYFYSNAIEDRVCEARSITTDSPAGTRKVLGLCRALKTADVKATIISMGRGSVRNTGAYHPPYVGRFANVPIVYGPMYDRALFSQLLTMGWLFAMAVRLGARRRGSVHLFYNQLTAYIPALAWLWFTKQKTSVDIEDGPIADYHKRYGRRFANAPPEFYDRLVNNGALVACRALGDATRISPVLPYYGAVDVGSREPLPLKYRTSARLEVLYGGLLNDDTGVPLFIATLDLLRLSNDPSLASLSINIAGMGPGLIAFKRFGDGERPTVRVLGRVTNEEYGDLLNRCAIGLSLRPVMGDYSESTFPSKIVEYAEHGLAVVATDVSDTRILFGDAVIYIEGGKAEALATQLKRAVAHPEEVIQKADAAAKVVQDQLSFPSAGRALKAFLFSGTALDDVNN